jgi:hypothetical protein
VIAYKFLGPGRVGLFSGFRWPDPGGVVRVGEPLDPCRNGIHACRVGDLPYWIDDELWEIEIEEPAVELDRLVLTAAATVVRQVESWQPEAFVAGCLAEVEAAATGDLGRAFLADLRSLARGGRPDEVPPIAGEGAPSPGALAANLGFVTAHALGELARAEAGDYDAAVTAERARQGRFIAALLPG